MAEDDEYYDSDSDFSNTPPELQEIASATALELLPHKSQILYEKQYKTFKNWCMEQKVKNITEIVFVAYFSSKASIWKSSTMWSIYSMLKSTLAVKENIDISKYAKLRAFLKMKNVGYKPKKSKVFTRDEINTFLRDAPNDSYLMSTVCFIFGIAGACRRDELRKMKVQDIVDQGDMLIITIPDSKNGKKRIFTVTDELCEGVSPLAMFREYAALRPEHCDHNTFFINYRLRKCTTQVIGVHTFAKIPSLIAKYLHLPNESHYTGHCYRRTSATLLVNAGADVLSLKKHGGWKSSTVAEGYVEDSIPNKINVAKSILTGTSLQSFSNKSNVTSGRTVCQSEVISNTTTSVESATTKEQNVFGVACASKSALISMIVLIVQLIYILIKSN